MNDLVPYGKRIAVDELRRAFDSVMHSSDALDTKLQAILSGTSIIIAIAGAVQFTQLGAAISRAGLLAWLVLIAIACMYIALFWTVLRALRSESYDNPISFKWETLDQRYFNESEDTSLTRLIADYVNCAPPLVRSNQQKATAVDSALILFATIVTLLVILPAILLA